MRVFKLKSLLALILVCVFFLNTGVMTVSAASDDPCNGEHSFDAFYAAFYTECGGGFMEDYQVCSECNFRANMDGEEIYYVEGNGNHVLGEWNEANYTECNGGYMEDFRYCEVCCQAINANNEEIGYYAGTDVHTPGDELHEADYSPCSGGFSEDFYLCVYCGIATDAEGNYLDWEGGTGEHTPGDELYDPDYIPCIGGYPVAHYRCVDCNTRVDADGYDLYWEEGSGKHELDSEVYQADYTPCGGGYMEPYYMCKDCYLPIGESDRVLMWYEGTGEHVPGMLFEANYASCGGGFKEDYYECEYCYMAINADGEEIMWYDGTGVHTPGTTLSPADYTECSGGFTEDYYDCIYCYASVDTYGVELMWCEGDGNHVPGSTKYESDYTPCNGGFLYDYYSCIYCYMAVDADGNEVSYWSGDDQHTPGTVLHKPTYTACGGGINQSYYRCTACLRAVNAQGKPVSYTEGTGRHTPGTTVYPADYTVCGGGLTEDYTVCTQCSQILTVDGGTDISWEMGTGRHTPGSTLYAANLSACGGGYKANHYECVDCGAAVSANGSELAWYPAVTDEHSIVWMQEIAPTTQTIGLKAHWECEYCGTFFNSNDPGDEMWKAQDYEDLIIPVASANLKITSQPKSETVAAGSMIGVNVVAEGEGLTYQWFCKDAGSSTFFKSSIATSSYYTKMYKEYDGRQLYCVVTDKYGNSVKSNTVTLTLASTVKITSQPKSETVVAGSMIGVNVVAEGEGLTYQWFCKDAGSSSFFKSSIATSSYYTKMYKEYDGRQLYCVVTDKYGNSVKSNTVTLTLASTVKITSQPKSETVAAGSMIGVNVVAEGEGLTYQWYCKDAGSSSFFKSSIATSGYYTKMYKEYDGRQLYCVVTDKNGYSVKSDIVTLTLASTVKITSQPKSETVAAGSMIGVNVVAEGEGLTYQWYCKDAGSSYFFKSSIATSGYYTKMYKEYDGRQLYCVVTDKNGYSVKSDVVTLTLASTVKITSQPKSETVAAGSMIGVNVVAEGEGLTYQWFCKDAGSSSFFKSSIKTSSYYTKMYKEYDGRQLYCVVTDKNGNSVKSNVVTLTLASSLKITSQPKSETVAAGSMIGVNVVAEGEGLTYQWYCKDAGSSYFFKSSIKTSGYYTKMYSEYDGRQLYCVVTDQYGNSVTSDTVTLTVG